MKITPRFPAKTLSALLVTGLLGTLILTAADPNATPPQRNRPGGGAGGGGPGGPGFRGGLMLDDKQRELLREAMQKNGAEIQKLDEKMRAAQKELTQAILTEKQDSKVLRDKAEAVAKIQVEQTLLRAKVFGVVVPTLKPEQRDQIENSPFAMQMLMQGLGGGFGGGGMRGGRGGGPPQQ